MKRIDKIEISEKYYEELENDIYYFKKYLFRSRNINTSYIKKLKTIIDFLETYLYLLDK